MLEKVICQTNSSPKNLAICYIRTCIYKPRQSDELRQYPYEVNIPLGQKHPSVHPPIHCSFSFASHVWGHSGPHC